ncbi:putative carboxylesterase, 2-hydroxyisoflavanone dehydratase [Rosa chinensis]|uniref:Putative carboxylesterase, 2-hydroxyisoflavanone dehydratase n=1 Tax=Rosa chinensis TaxID=74649 RepID=A0A2P6SEB2_ROSCH|nr:2-hydroxyisoflavanone dehydratase [Rosa chinensis]PRQ57017.1 putative carboxylesterase, 2-hydroxyisoflavanone dehydratase [Rosa chinensis]
MASSGKEIASELLPLIRVYKDGTVERLMGSPYVSPSLHDPEYGVCSKDITISHNPKISARLFCPQTLNQHVPNQKLPVLVYFHGGGFCFESAFSSDHHRFLNRLVSKAQVVAISVEYRLAPEVPLPFCYQDCWAALQWVASHIENEERVSAINKEPWLASYGDFDRVYIGGDSTGGNIVHNIAMKAGTESLSVKIVGAFMSHPYLLSSKPLALEPKGEEFEKYLPCLVWGFLNPSAPGGLDNPMVNPVGLGAPSMAGLGCSKLLVCLSSNDELRPRGVWYYNLVMESGWKGEVELFEVEGEGHAFQIFSVAETHNVKKIINKLASFLV